MHASASKSSNIIVNTFAYQISMRIHWLAGLYTYELIHLLQRTHMCKYSQWEQYNEDWNFVLYNFRIRAAISKYEFLKWRRVWKEGEYKNRNDAENNSPTLNLSLYNLHSNNLDLNRLNEKFSNLLLIFW